MSWEIVIGLETHAQLSTASKMFSGASTAFGAAPNTQASAVDIALPGVLPVANKGAVERAILFGLLVNGGHPDNINRRSIFARKNYFYPDLPKGYQISQYELPIVKGGEVPIVSPTRGKIKIRLTRAHLEEDAGKSLHEDFHGMSGIDLNRAGTPLLEIVSEPEMRSAEEAVAYAKVLYEVVTWNEICDGNMDEGSFRCDANVSVRRPGEQLGTRCEIKNLNSFRFLQEAIEYEVKRQINIIEDGGKIVQETRLYDSEKRETRSMRTKEEAHDYRYFPDPDLPSLEVSEADLERARVRVEQTEQPQTKRARYVRELVLSLYDAELLTKDRSVAGYFEAVLNDPELKSFDPRTVAKLAANFINGELAAELNEEGISIKDSPVKPNALAGHVKNLLVDIPVSTGKKQFHTLWAKSREPISTVFKDIPQHPKVSDDLRLFVVANPDTKVGEWSGSSTAAFTIADLWATADTGELDRVVDEVLAANAKQVEDYRAGKDKAFNSLVGQVMKATKGKANPAQVNEILKRKLGR